MDGNLPIYKMSCKEIDAKTHIVLNPTNRTTQITNIPNDSN